MKRKTDLAPWLLILPHAVFFCAFVAWPIFKALWMSLFKWGIFKGPVAFVGLDNYLKLFVAGTTRAAEYWFSVWVTAQFVAYSVPLFVLVSLILALVLNDRALRAPSVHMTAWFLPTALSATVIACLWRMIFNDTGFINSMILLSGGNKVGWLSNLPGAWVTLVAATLWWTVGWNVIIIYSSRKKIPETLYDAAKVDGAGRLRTFWAVTVPGLKNVMLYVVTTQTLASFGLFAQPQLMTRGYPGRSTIPVALHMYGVSFGTSGDTLGLGAAMSVVTGLVILVCSAVIFASFGTRKETVK